VRYRRIPYLKIAIGLAVASGAVVFLCVLFCTHETVAEVVDISWTHTVTLQELRTSEVCESVTTTNPGGRVSTRTECHDEDTWETVDARTHQGDNFRHTTWPLDPKVGYKQRIQRDAEYVVTLRNSTGQWQHKARNLSEAQRFKYKQLWVAKVNRVGLAWPQRQTGPEQ
jgi:hypothetical protein